MSQKPVPIDRSRRFPFVDAEKARILAYLEVFNRTSFSHPWQKLEGFVRLILALVVGWRSVGRTQARWFWQIVTRDLRKLLWLVYHPKNPTPEQIQKIGDVPITEGDKPLKLGNIKRLKSLHNRFSGQRIFVIGNGPSLNKTPLHLLKNEYTYACNRIDLLFDRIDWRPSFYSAFDIRVVPDNADLIRSLDIKYKFFASLHRATLGEQDNHYYYMDNSLNDGLNNRFEPEAVYTGFGGGGTIATLMIQIAFFLGFDPIYLIGIDASYKVLPTVKQSGPDKFGDGILLNLESTADDDPNHFDPRYFGKGKLWHNPNVSEMVRGFENCRRAIERRDRHIYNATVGGKLEALERVDIHSLF